MLLQTVAPCTACAPGQQLSRSGCHIVSRCSARSPSGPVGNAASKTPGTRCTHPPLSSQWGHSAVTTWPRLGLELRRRCGCWPWGCWSVSVARLRWGSSSPPAITAMASALNTGALRPRRCSSSAPTSMPPRVRTPRGPGPCHPQLGPQQRTAFVADFATYPPSDRPARPDHPPRSRTSLPPALATFLELVARPPAPLRVRSLALDHLTDSSGTYAAVPLAKLATFFDCFSTVYVGTADNHLVPDIYCTGLLNASFTAEYIGRSVAAAQRFGAEHADQPNWQWYLNYEAAGNYFGTGCSHFSPAQHPRPPSGTPPSAPPLVSAEAFTAAYAQIFGTLIPRLLRIRDAAVMWSPTFNERVSSPRFLFFSLFFRGRVGWTSLFFLLFFLVLCSGFRAPNPSVPRYIVA